MSYELFNYFTEFSFYPETNFNLKLYNVSKIYFRLENEEVNWSEENRNNTCSASPPEYTGPGHNCHSSPGKRRRHPSTEALVVVKDEK